MTRSAVASAARSNRSLGLLTEIPPGTGVPSTGPERCWTTWVSSWASVRSWPGAPWPWPSPRTISLPTVYACASTARAEAAALPPAWTRTSEKSVPKLDSMRCRTAGSRGVPPPRPTTSFTGDSCSASPSKSRATPAFPAARWRRRTEAWPSASVRPAAAARAASAVAASSAPDRRTGWRCGVSHSCSWRCMLASSRTAVASSDIVPLPSIPTRPGSPPAFLHLSRSRSRRTTSRTPPPRRGGPASGTRAPSRGPGPPWPPAARPPRPGTRHPPPRSGCFHPTT